MSDEPDYKENEVLVLENNTTNEEIVDESGVNESEEKRLENEERNGELESVNMPESDKLSNEHKFEIKQYIVYVLLCILVALYVQTALVFILCGVFLLTQHYLYFLYTFLAVLAPIIILTYISMQWERIHDETYSNSIKYVVKSFSIELLKFRHCFLYKKCIEISKQFAESCKYESTKSVKQKYIDAIRHIEDFRYYTATKSLLQGVVHLGTQIWVVAHFNNNIYIVSLQLIIIFLSSSLVICCIVAYRSGFCDFRNDLGIYRLSIFTFFITIMSMTLYFSDIITDLVVTGKYFWYGHTIRGGITILFVILPGIYSTWHEHYRKKLEFVPDRTLVPLMLFNLSPLMGYKKGLNLLLETRKAEVAKKEKQQIVNYLEYIENSFHIANSRYVECFTESCPQLIIQISFLLSTINFSALQNEKFNILSSVVSVLNVAVSLVMFFRAKRIKNNEEDPLPILGMIIQFVGYIPVASRVVALSFLASVHPLYTFLGMFLHWLSIFLWIVYCCKRHFLFGHLNNVGQAVFYTYTPAINTICIEIIFQSVFFIENIAAVLFWGFSKYGRLTTNAIYILVFAIIVPSIIGWSCRYLYRTRYRKWMNGFEEYRQERNLFPMHRNYENDCIIYT